MLNFTLTIHICKKQSWKNDYTKNNCSHRERYEACDTFCAAIIFAYLSNKYIGSFYFLTQIIFFSHILQKNSTNSDINAVYAGFASRKYD